jgi:dephospho-CoA kinase
MPIKKKMSQADILIPNDGTLEELYRNITK